MRIFITGGTGFLGRHLIPALQQRGHQVVALVRTYERARELPRGVRAVAGDVTQPAHYAAHLNGCDVVIHAASAHTLGPGRAERERLERINVVGGRLVREAAAKASVGRIVHVSHASVYGDRRGAPACEGDPADPTLAVTFGAGTRARAHAEAVAAQAAGAPIIVVVPGQIYAPETPQPADADFAVWRRDGFWVLSGAGALRCWTPVGDVARGLCDAVEHGRLGAVYHLAGTSGRANALHSTIGPKRVWLPTPLARFAARLLRDAWPSQAERWRAHAGADYVLDCARARADLGWIP